jgi:D-glycero-D-manno-heptose 1,7-bisphosphate phosphatase
VEPSRDSSRSNGLVRRALFVDRDGTLNPDLHYLKEAERVELFRGVGDALSLAHDHGFLVVCVTNQSGVERGLYTDGDVERIHARLNELLRPHRARIDAFYYCPHAPEHGCACRKPGTLLFEQARDAWNIDFGSSAIVGDRGLDIEAGRRLGLVTAIVPRPGREAAADAELAERGISSDIVASTFENAVLRILNRG